jgi:LPXTG-motif cell wall-anchored protein
LSQEAPVGLTIMEKLIGLIMIAVGAITFYVTYTNLTGVGTNPILFLAAGLALVVLGVFLVIAKTE